MLFMQFLFFSKEMNCQSPSRFTFYPIMFLAYSDDIERAKTMQHSKENERFNLELPLVDCSSPTTRITLSLLSLCEDSILTYSTFGLWGDL